MTQDLLETRDGGIVTLTMNRPEARNALSREMMNAMAEAFNDWLRKMGESPVGK